MSLILSQTKTALAAGLTASFLAAGGVAPYVYSVRPEGAGGTIDSSTGLYTAPAAVDPDPKKAYDTVTVVDSLGAKGQSLILVGHPLILFCEIISRELGLANDRVFLWDQKVFQPTDEKMFIAVGVLRSKPFANSIGPADNAGSPDWSQATQSVNTVDELTIDVISRSTEALLRKEEVLMALGSQYAEFQQEGNSFSIGKLPPGSQFLNLSIVDGAAIPYRFRISVNMQYAATKTKPVDYFDTFQSVQVTADA